MRATLLPLLRCPAGCDPELSLSAYSDADDDIASGEIACPDCGRMYPIDDGIARLLPSELDPLSMPATSPVTPGLAEPVSESEWKLSEARARDAQVHHYDRMWHLKLFGVLEVPLTLAHLSLRPHHTLLEAGCGTGRMTRSFARRCARVVAADFSWESLRSNALKLREAGVRNVDLIQADVCRLPLRSEAFDRVVSCQVLEHVPSASCRDDAVREMVRVLKPGGDLALSAYRHSRMMGAFGPKEGAHPGGIYYYRFEKRELRELLSRHVAVRSIASVLVYCHLARCRKGGG